MNRSVPKAAPGLLFIALFTSAVSADPPSQPRFTITELPTLGGVGSRGVAVNRAGVVCGESNRFNEGYMVATAWLPPTYQPVYLTGSGGSVATGSAVNEAGTIVGFSDVLENAYRAAPPGGPAATIGEMGTHGGMAADITQSGDICGTWSGFGAEGSHPFMIRAGVFTALPLLEGGTQGAAAAINEPGLVVGWSEEGLNGGHTRAAKWMNGIVSQLTGGESLNSAYAVNDDGWIVGYTSDPSFPPTIATLWIDPAHPIDLGTLAPSHWQNMAYAVNSRRQIVGTSGVRAFLWENGVMRDLATMIPANTPASTWLLYSANGISDNGLIVGEGLHNGVIRGFLLTPITPAPLCVADVASLGGNPGADGQLTADDLVYFLQQFFASNLAICDVAILGGSPGSDAQITPDDLVYFLNLFFGNCG